MAGLVNAAVEEFPAGGWGTKSKPGKSKWNKC